MSSSKALNTQFIKAVKAENEAEIKKLLETKNIKADVIRGSLRHLRSNVTLGKYLIEHGGDIKAIDLLKDTMLDCTPCLLALFIEKGCLMTMTAHPMSDNLIGLLLYHGDHVEKVELLLGNSEFLLMSGKDAGRFVDTPLYCALKFRQMKSFELIFRVKHSVLLDVGLPILDEVFNSDACISKRIELGEYYRFMLSAGVTHKDSQLSYVSFYEEEMRVRKAEEKRIRLEYEPADATAKAEREKLDRERHDDVERRRQQEVRDRLRLAEIDEAQKQRAKREQRQIDRVKRADIDCKQQEDLAAQQPCLAALRDRTAAEQAAECQRSLEGKFKEAVRAGDYDAVEAIIDCPEYAPSEMIWNCLKYCLKVKELERRLSKDQAEADARRRDLEIGKQQEVSNRARLAEIDEVKRQATERDRLATEAEHKCTLRIAAILVKLKKVARNATGYHDNDGTVVALCWLLEAIDCDAYQEVRECVKVVHELAADQTQRLQLIRPMIDRLMLLF